MKQQEMSSKGTNTHMADIILEILFSKIKHIPLLEQTKTRIRQRRSISWDVLLYLKQDSKDISLYKRPSFVEIEQLYNQVLYF